MSLQKCLVKLSVILETLLGFFFKDKNTCMIHKISKNLFPLQFVMKQEYSSLEFKLLCTVCCEQLHFFLLFIFIFDNIKDRAILLQTELIELPQHTNYGLLQEYWQSRRTFIQHNRIYSTVQCTLYSHDLGDILSHQVALRLDNKSHELI